MDSDEVTLSLLFERIKPSEDVRLAWYNIRNELQQLRDDNKKLKERINGK